MPNSTSAVPTERSQIKAETSFFKVLFMIISSNWTCRCLKKDDTGRNGHQHRRSSNDNPAVVLFNLICHRFDNAFCALPWVSESSESIIEARINSMGKLRRLSFALIRIIVALRWNCYYGRDQRTDQAVADSKNELSLWFLKKGCLRAHVVDKKFCGGSSRVTCCLC